MKVKKRNYLIRTVYGLFFLFWVLVRYLTPNWLSDSNLALLDYCILFFACMNIVISTKYDLKMGKEEVFILLLGILSMIFIYDFNECTQSFNSRIPYLFGVSMDKIFNEHILNVLVIVLFISEVILLLRFFMTANRKKKA